MISSYSLLQNLLQIGKLDKKHQRACTQQLFKHEELGQLVDCCQSDNSVVCRACAAILHALCEINCKEFCQVVKDQLCDVFVCCCKSLVEHEQFEDVTEHVVEMMGLVATCEDGKYIRN